MVESKAYILNAEKKIPKPSPKTQASRAAPASNLNCGVRIAVGQLFPVGSRMYKGARVKKAAKAAKAARHKAAVTDTRYNIRRRAKERKSSLQAQVYH